MSKLFFCCWVTGILPYSNRKKGHGKFSYRTLFPFEKKAIFFYLIKQFVVKNCKFGVTRIRISPLNYVGS